MGHHVIAPSYLLLAVAGLTTPTHAQTPDEIAVRRVIEEAYVSGVFVARDSAAVRRGFHPEFSLAVLQNDRLLVVGLDAWLARLKLDGRRTTDRVEHIIDRIDLAGNTAHVTMRMFINGRHTYTDFMGLYRFPEGWRIVNKVFQGHD
jgi:hypothetical protein